MAVSAKTRNLAFKQLSAYIRQNDLRPSRTRDMVLERVCLMPQPFTAEQLIQSVPTGTISLGTFYNTLNLLVLAQILCATNRQRGQASTEYELVVGKTARMQIICTKCGRVQETKDRVLDKLIKERKYTNFIARHYSLFVYGECKSCRVRKKENN